MKLLHVIASLSAASGGVARAVIDLAWNLALGEPGEAVESTILTYRAGPMDAPWLQAPTTPAAARIRVIEAGPRPGPLSAGTMRGHMAREIATCDVIHLHGMWHRHNTVAAAAARAVGKPYICSPHGMLDPWSMSVGALKKRLFLRLFEARRLAGATAIHFTTGLEAQKAHVFLPAAARERSRIAPLFVELAAGESISRAAARADFGGVPADAPWIAFVSRIHPKKRLDLLIEAVAQLPERHHGAQLVIGGTGDEAHMAAMHELAARLGVAGRTHFVGHVQGRRKGLLYRAAQCLTIPTSQENFGLVFPEALAQGTPVALTRHVDLYPDILEAGGGWLIEQDASKIAGVLAQILDDPAAADRKGEAGRQWVQRVLSPQALTARWRALYTEVAAGRRGKV